MRKFLLLLLILIFATPAAYSQDDDSMPYMPYQEQPKQSTSTKKTTKKASTTKKTTTSKKTTNKAPSNKATKPAAPVVTSLQQGIKLLNEGRYTAAGEYLRKAIQENRNDPNAYYWYGVYHDKIGKYHQAQTFYTKAITIDPTFDPLSRAVYYPHDDEKTALWDPKRPAKVYPIETSNKGLTISSTNNYPTSPYDPTLPKVPVYLPPEPGANPEDGDPWGPLVYVPPAPDETTTTTTTTTNTRYTVDIPITASSRSTTKKVVENDVRADLPLYEPPEPGDPVVKVSAVPTTAEPKKTVTTSSKSETKSPAAPRKVVKASEKNKSTTSTKTKPTTSTKPVSSDVKPAKSTKSTTTKRKETPMPIVPNTKDDHDTEKSTTEYLPPVGQLPPDPGTVPETMIPPVGQPSK